MKKFFTACLLAVSALSAAAAPSTVMGAGKETVTAEDLVGVYGFDWFNLTISEGYYIGPQLGKVWPQILTTDDPTVVILRQFFYEKSEDLYATFDAENLTLKIPNGAYLGEIVFNEGQVNERRFESYLRYCKANTNELVGEDIILKVEPDKRRIIFQAEKSSTQMYGDYEYLTELYIADEEATKYSTEIGWFTMNYSNYNDSYRYSTEKTTNKVARYAEYDEEKSTINIYHFGSTDWYVDPIEFHLSDDRTEMVAIDQVFVSDPNPAFALYMTQPQYFNPFKAYAYITNGENGYDVVMPEWCYADINGFYFSTIVDYKGTLLGDFFGETAPKPVISPDPSTLTADEIRSGEILASITGPEDAEIYYTIDGTTPTESSINYSSDIPVREDLIIKAIAVKDGVLPSHVTVVRYNVPEEDIVDTIAMEDFEVSVVGNVINAPEGARIFSIDGTEYKAGASLNSGIYVVTLNNNSRKVVVK